MLLQKKGTDPSILLTAGITARISSILWVPAVAWLAAARQQGVLRAHGASERGLLEVAALEFGSHLKRQILLFWPRRV